MNWFDLFAKVPEAVSGFFQKREERKIREKELEAALHQKRLEGIHKADEYEHAWNLAQIQNSGWKDEYWTIVLSIPAIGSFIPKFSVYIQQGFEALAATPTWYQYIFTAAVLSAFGLKMTDRIWKWWHTP